MMNRSLFVLLPIVATLAACGGGGDSAPVIQQPAPAPVVEVGLVTDVATPSYSSGTEELAAFNLLNAERSACGFGKLAQNTALDAAASGHADWNLINSYTGHYQVTNTVGFTGVNAEDRAVAAGYGDIGTFLIQDLNTLQMGSSVTKQGYGEQAIRQLLNAPYHAVGMIAGWREVGISVRHTDDVATTASRRVTAQVNPAYGIANGPQLIGSNEVATYPCDGSTGIHHSLFGENPNPVPGRDLLNNPLGSSVQVMLREGHTLAITSASMVNAVTQAAVTLRAPVTSANDPYGPCLSGCFQSNQGYIVADAPLAANTTYTVTISGTNNGVAFTKTFNFTTGE